MCVMRTSKTSADNEGKDASAKKARKREQKETEGGEGDDDEDEDDDDEDGWGGVEEQATEAREKTAGQANLLQGWLHDVGVGIARALLLTEGRRGAARWGRSGIPE